jgi:tetratricopeptide (TPR) repeat protein
MGPDYPNVAAAKSSLALLLMTKGDLAAGDALFREAADIYRRVFGPNSTEYAGSLSNLGLAAEWQNRLADAQANFEESLRIAEPQLGSAHPRVVAYVVNLSRVRIARGDGAATESALREALRVREKLYPPGDWRIAQVQSLLGAALMAAKRDAEAEPLMLAADRGLKPIAGIQERERSANRARLEKLRAERK